jgi:hypothetical protein
MDSLMSSSHIKKKIGVSGTGMIAHCFIRLIKQHYHDLEISRVPSLIFRCLNALPIRLII